MDTLRNCFFLIALLLAPSVSQATIMDLPDAAGIGYFEDTATGLKWMDVDNFFGMSYTEIEAAISGTGYKIANLSEIQLLHSSLAYDDYFAWNSILGDNNRGNTNIVWGFYDISQPSVAGESWMYSDLATNGGGKQWNYSTLGVPGYFSPYDVSKSAPAADRGAWVVQIDPGTQIPEPTTVLLMGIGLGAAYRRKRKA